MNTISYILSALIFNYSVECLINVSEPHFKELPPIFKIDDLEQCKEQGKLYCRVSIIIEPNDPEKPSSHWKLIQETVKHPKFYNHNELFHSVCVDDFCSKSVLENSRLDNPSKLSECYRLKYEGLDLRFVINDLSCGPFDKVYSPGSLDLIVLASFAAYLSVIIFATYKNSKANQRKQKEIWTKEHKILSTFSIIANWKKLCTINDRPDFQKLKFIQGIRFYNMLLVIFCHTVCSYIGGYISNTEYFEQLDQNPARLFISTLFVFLVQTFFLISAFLLSYHMYQSMEEYKESKWRYVVLTFINRYLRILPPVFVMIVMARSVWIIRLFKGPIRDMYVDKEYERCQKNWWTNLLFINNHYNESEMCYFLTWYLAADTQLYLVSLIVLLFAWKFRQRSQLILSIVMAIGVLIPMVICYKYDLDIIFRLIPENSKNDQFRSFKFNTTYTSTFTNMASFMVGLGLGYFYFVQENTRKYHKYFRFLWMTIFGFLPVFMVLISSYEYPKYVTMVLAGLVKPCYALGIGLGILAMSQQKNGLIKKICELRPVLFLGNFTYSTYVVQYGVVFYRTAIAKEPLYISDYVLVTSFIQDAILSILCGFLMHIFVEMPALQLQKMYIPQIKRLIPSKNCKKTN